MLETIARVLTDDIRETSLLLEAIPEDSREAAKHLAFQAEIVLERIESTKDREHELLVCMAELEREWARERMRVLASDINQAEQKGEAERLTTLLAEFSVVSQKIR